MEKDIDENDEDMFTDYKDAFHTSYNLAESVNLGGDTKSAYVLYLAGNSNKSAIAAGLSTSKISVCDVSCLSEKASFESYKDGDLSGLMFSPKNENLIYACSPQECIRLWDIRDCRKPARSFIDTSTQNKRVENGHEKGEGQTDFSKKPLICMDVNINDEFLVGGTEQVVKDAFLLFWDVGSGKMLGGYWDSYGDDVTTVAFHPEDANKLATGGTDGLINVFDVSQSSEDDALITSINTESSIQDICWYKVSHFENYKF